MMLTELGLPEWSSPGEAVAIIVGPNGSGKSNFLRALASHYQHRRQVTVICNTVHDRFAGMRNIRRLSAGRSEQSPRNIVKEAVAETLDKEGPSFFYVAAILEHCGYNPRFGFQIRRPSGHPKRTYDDEPPFRRAEYERAIEFVDRNSPRGLFWIDPREPIVEFARGRDFGTVLRMESRLRAEKFVLAIDVFLERRDGKVIEMHRASSGELALISSLVFLASKRLEFPLIIVDEPENSLHPAWQRDYVDKILAAMSYSDATIVMATHAPLVVTGAITAHRDRVSVFQIDKGRTTKLELDDKTAATSGIEEILWRAFDIVTPANHFVSERLAEAMSEFERGKIEKRDILLLIDSMASESFDPQQREFFDAVLDLVDRVERRNARPTDQA